MSDFRCSAFRWLLYLVPNGPHLIKLKQKTILQFERIYHIQKTKTDDRTDLGQKNYSIILKFKKYAGVLFQ